MSTARAAVLRTEDLNTRNGHGAKASFQKGNRLSFPKSSLAGLSDAELGARASAIEAELIRRTALRVALGRMSRRAGLEAVRSMGVSS